MVEPPFSRCARAFLGQLERLVDVSHQRHMHERVEMILAVCEIILAHTAEGAESIVAVSHHTARRKMHGFAFDICRFQHAVGDDVTQHDVAERSAIRITTETRLRAYNAGIIVGVRIVGRLLLQEQVTTSASILLSHRIVDVDTRACCSEMVGSLALCVAEAHEAARASLEQAEHRTARTADREQQEQQEQQEKQGRSARCSGRSGHWDEGDAREKRGEVQRTEQWRGGGSGGGPHDGRGWVQWHCVKRTQQRKIPCEHQLKEDSTSLLSSTVHSLSHGCWPTLQHNGRL
jgi:Ni/Co efflux regulator RcnB